MSEWDRMMKIDISRTSFFWGENKTIPDTSSESICPPTSLNCKGPIDLTDTVIFNPFEFALFSSSPRTLPTLDGGRVQIEVPRQGGGATHQSCQFVFFGKGMMRLWDPWSWQVDVILRVCFVDFQCCLGRAEGEVSAEGHGCRVHMRTPPTEQKGHQPYKFCPVDLVWKSSCHSVYMRSRELREREVLNSNTFTCRSPALRASRHFRSI